MWSHENLSAGWMSYNHVIASISIGKKAQLAQLNDWYFGESSLDRESLVKIMTWKLLQGTFRPGLLNRMKSNDAKTVKAVLTQLQGQTILREQLKTLCTLNGVGPATASAILSHVNPNVVFMSDPLLHASGILKPKYTLKEYDTVCEWASSQLASLKSQGHEWVPREFERAIWSISRSNP